MEEKQSVRLLTLNRPKQLNALSSKMVRLAIGPFIKPSVVIFGSLAAISYYYSTSFVCFC